MNISDEEVESFDITEDDLASEMNPGRFRKRQTKNKQIYGIWARDSDEEEERTSRRGESSGQRRGFSGTAPVAFVSAGIQQPKKEAAEEKEDEEQAGPDITDSSSEDEVQFVSAQKSKKLFEYGSMAGMRQSSSGVAKGYEMFGKGAKMAMMMGFQPGKGLGKDLQGIAAPIEAHKRKGRGAIGAYGREVKTKVAEPIVPTEKPANAPTPQLGESKWQKDGSGSKTKEKVQYNYVTAEEVLKQRHISIRPDAGALGKVKVIDKTGPQERVLSGYHAIAGQRKPTEEWEADGTSESKAAVSQKSAFELPELMYNVHLLVDTCEQDILKNEKKIKYNNERKDFLENEIKSLRKRRDYDATVANHLKTIINDLNGLKNIPNMTNDRAIGAINHLKTDYSEEWEMYSLYDIIPAVAIPLLKDQLKHWNPLTAPKFHLDTYQDWRVVSGSREDIFEGLIWETWMPTIRQTILNLWNIKEAESLINVIDTWRTILADWIYQNILDQLVFPKIQSGVDSWDPLSDPVPIHAWIHPWLRHLGEKLEIVYPTIRKKLSDALNNWHPGDSSAKKILAPWSTVFPKGSMDAFLLKNILPKLHMAMAMHDFAVNPLPQNMDSWNWVMDWLDMIPAKAIVQILDTVFFPKWIQFLVNWLNSYPNFEEVSRWYAWWRQVIPAEIINDPVIQGHLTKALQILGRAIQNPGQPIDLVGLTAQPANQGPGPVPQMQASSSLAQDVMVDVMRMPSDLKELIQMRCEQIGLLFVPMLNRYYEGKQIYRCGNVFIYMKANVIYIQRDGIWYPASIAQLLETATNS